jgi:3-oxoacyl-[acyl-carrier-protein] synthase II
VINAAAGQTAIWHNLRGVNSTISAGIPSGLQALAYATDLIRTGRVQAVLAGGVEELCFESLYGFRRANLTCPIDEPRPYPFAPDRNGFALSEGTGMLMLESEDAAAARNAEVLAVVLGHGSSFAASGAGQAITRAIRTSLNDAGLSPSDVDLVSASANGSCADQNESEALADVFRGCSPAPVVTAIKSMVGESLGASAAWQTIIAIEILSGGRIPGPYGLDPAEPGRGKLAVPSSTCQRIVRNALINSVGIDGNCCAFVLGEPHNNRSASGSSTHVSR